MMEKHPDLTEDRFEIVPLSNASGDMDQKQHLHKMTSVGVFAKRVEIALLEDECDIAVHSMKDLQTAVTEGLVVVAVPEMSRRTDVVVFSSKHKGKTLDDLPEGAVIGSSSLRRIHSLRHLYGERFEVTNI